MRKLFTLFILLLTVSKVFGEADLFINRFNVAPIWIEFKTVSIPFEGLNSINNSNYIYNRFQQVQAGNFHRRFFSSGYKSLRRSNEKKNDSIAGCERIFL